MLFTYLQHKLKHRKRPICRKREIVKNKIFTNNRPIKKNKVLKNLKNCFIKVLHLSVESKNKNLIAYYFDNLQKMIIFARSKKE